MGNLITIFLLTAAVIFSLIFMVKKYKTSKKNGGCGWSCGCSDCSGCVKNIEYKKKEPSQTQNKSELK